MLFNSITFLLFFPTVFLVDLVLQRKAWMRKGFLLGASYLFYAGWDWRFLGLIWASTIIDWFVGNALQKQEVDLKRRLLLTISLVGNLGMLCTFKYLDFFIESTNMMLEGIGFSGHIEVLRLLLPVGISFYTFQTLSYTIDIYRRQLKPARSFLDFALFVAFFPQLVAGPIVRASHFIPQLYKNPRASRADVSKGLYEIAVGLFKKVVIADILGNHLASPFYDNPEQFGFWGAMLGIYGFSFQVYGDFAGYSGIAIGCARILGFELPVNFRWPFMARNIVELWSKWHISLSTWLRDYLFIPLGGSRGGRWFIYRNIIITNLLAGLWHGAGWNYVIWGGYNGLTICWGHHQNAKRKASGIGQSNVWWHQVMQRLLTYHT
ncbi:MAG: MBOAT family O-acyltransferase, partial [Planctomycetota bacterium]